ncbi:MAG: hypothetical protein M3Y12_00805 [Bacteroidota bacterium]|nr:hypothetical protein [Bacteroidota bacterium]
MTTTSRYARPPPPQTWVGDMTCVPHQSGGWLYLAVWFDWYSRKAVG